MGYFSCNAESAIATCDPHFWDLNNTKTNSTLRTIRKFNYTDLVAATNSFSDDNFLGKGSHGNVYKATVDGGKIIAAVKTTKFTTKTPTSRHNITTCTGCGHCTSPAENEIEILSHVNSSRIVNLIGFSTDQNDNKLIVVEYMPNGSLHDLLHSPVRALGWSHRIRFALQVAKAVHTLHSSNPPIIHRDIKSSNVLIDGDRKARLGDFGLALRGHVEDVRVKCTPPAGTLGYLDPCYLAPGDLSAKSDVFSFGILLLEILSGRNAIDVNYSPPSVVDWAVPLIKRGEFTRIYDRRIGPPTNDVVVRQLAVLAARCVRSTAERRPSMAEVVEWVNNARKRLGAVAVWSTLRRRVGRVERFDVFECGDVDKSGEVVKAVKCGSRRKKGKVSSVTGAEYQNEPSNDVNGVVRCESIGSGSIMKMGLDRNKGGYPTRMRLNKCRSMGYLHGPTVIDYGNNGSESKHKSGPIHLVEMAMTNLVITQKLEEKMLETPLVGNLSNTE